MNLNMTKAISPEVAKKESAQFRIDRIPQVVIQAVNNLIIKEMADNCGSTITITQKEIINEIIRLDPGMTSSKIYENNYLDFEDVYRKEGWKVSYDKPGYCESYEPKFSFTPNNK